MHVTLRPFQTPNFAIMQVPGRPRQEGFKEAPSFPLKEIDEDTLTRLCDEWRAEVFRKAGKPLPTRSVADLLHEVRQRIPSHGSLAEERINAVEAAQSYCKTL